MAEEIPKSTFKKMLRKMKLKKFVKEHRTEIVAVALMVIGGCVTVGVTKGLGKCKPVNIKDLPIPSGETGRIREFWWDANAKEYVAIIDELTIKDLGAVGERFCGVCGLGALSEACVTVEMR